MARQRGNRWQGDAFVGGKRLHRSFATREEAETWEAQMITQFVAHMLRHTCASRLVRGGTDLTRVKSWMGHKAIQTTLRYAHLEPHDLANVTFAHAAE